MSKPTDVLMASDEPEAKRKPRIDLAFERIVLQCGIGCLVRDIPLSDNDYVRLYLAISRLGKEK